MPNMNKWQRDYFLHLVGIYLSLRGRYNFLGFSRWGEKDEHTYRNHAISGFDFGYFNRTLILAHTGNERMLAFDPSYISKSGKKTAGVGYFWSGCASKMKWGLEVCGFSIVDVTQNTALHYDAVQTILKEDQNLMEFYCEQVKIRAKEIRKMTKLVGADAYFSKKAFVDTICQNELNLISRLRDDAVIHHAPPPKIPGKKGCPKKYGDRILLKNPQTVGLSCIEKTDEMEVYGGLAWVKSLRRMVKIAIVYEKKADNTFKKPKIYFCTDLNFDEKNIYPWYKSRFQIEFLFRDAKQHVGLEDCQSKSQKALEYHFNMSLTTVSLAKVAHHLSIDKDKRPPFSMANIKTRYSNELLVNRIFDAFANCPNIAKNNPIIVKLYNLGKIAA
jgi:Transposase DDE domain